MRVKKVAYLRKDSVICYVSNPMLREADLNAIFTNLQFPQGSAGTESPTEVSIEVRLTDHTLKLPVTLTKEILVKQLNAPQCLIKPLFIFRNAVYWSEIESQAEEEEDTILMIKKLAYEEDGKLKKLREEVNVLDRLVGNENIQKREVIPDAVKLYVYKRDEGKCICCGSNKELHFDHVIPFSKGGGNTEKNVQLLCQSCNLKKSDNIAF